MILLIDTNVLVRLEDALDPRHTEAMSAVDVIIGGRGEWPVLEKATW